MPTARAVLFDLAVNRAASVAERLGLAALGPWHQRTRFASRLELAQIVAAVAQKPSNSAITGPCYWAGGPGGGWQPGINKNP
jgi:hypothetical protein